MSFSALNPNPISPYPHHHATHPPCTMLPPLRPARPAPAPAASLTLSDCSDLSLSNRPDDHHHHLPAPHYQPYLPSISHGFSLPHHPHHLRHQPSALPPTLSANPTIRPARLTPKIAKAPKKIARARARLPTKHAPSRSDSQSLSHYKPAPPKKVRSSKSNIPGESRYWTPSEHKLFVEALLKYGPKDLKAISAYVRTRNMIQCRTHEQKCFMRLMREAQRETYLRNGQDWDAAYGSAKGEDGKPKPQKDVYSVPASCGITLLCVVSEEMQRSLQS